MITRNELKNLNLVIGLSGNGIHLDNGLQIFIDELSEFIWEIHVSYDAEKGNVNLTIPELFHDLDNFKYLLNELKKIKRHEIINGDIKDNEDKIKTAVSKTFNKRTFREFIKFENLKNPKWEN